MLFFEIEMDEDQVRSMVKAIVDNYEQAWHRHGNYQTALQHTQEVTVRTMENTAEAVEELIEHAGTMH